MRMSREEFMSKINAYHGLPPDAPCGTHVIVKCDCDKRHNDIFKKCPGWTLEPKPAKQIRREKAAITTEEADKRSAAIRKWRRKNGFKPTPLEKSASAAV
jgi:hypothetical protein